MRYMLQLSGIAMAKIFCLKCGSKVPADAVYCPNCGAALSIQSTIHDQIMIVTTPTFPGHSVVEVLGVVTGLTVGTRGVGGKFVA